ncbi:MAG: radical SAM protein [bacterium]|nr:radical SAM protein [bacterium]
MRKGYPGYVELYERRELKKRVDALYQRLASCDLCPRNCRVDRLKGEKGFCRSGAFPIISSVSPHFGEEPELVGRHGSGTIFLTNCNLLCIYCQNYDISHLGYGEEVSTEELAKQMLHLQDIGCHNINLVTPTHFVPQIVQAIYFAVEGGLNIPIIYNSGGYEKVETLRLLNGVVDIYMPDAKYSDPLVSKRYSKAEDYPLVMEDALREMYSQVGDLIIEQGIARHGLLVRHLVLPNNLAGSSKIMEFIASLSKNTYVNIMDQYRPMYKASEYSELNRPITISEYREVIETAKQCGLYRGFSNVDLL